MTQLQKGERVYVAEQDAHFSELTLGQTLAFTTGLRDVSSVLEYHGLADSTNSPSWTIASLFHLEKAFDTRVGNAMVRGISGGEKRRASLAEAYISSAQYQCWDNSTRGLDSSTALSFISLLRLITNKARLVMMMSIYQASEAQYQVFISQASVLFAQSVFRKTDQRRRRNSKRPCSSMKAAKSILVQPRWLLNISKTLDSKDQTIRQPQIS